MLTDRLRSLPLKAQLLNCLRLQGLLPQRINALGGWCTDSIRLKLGPGMAQVYSLNNKAPKVSVETPPRMRVEVTYYHHIYFVPSITRIYLNRQEYNQISDVILKDMHKAINRLK